jgi:hypothetical protein
MRSALLEVCKDFYLKALRFFGTPFAAIREIIDNIIAGDGDGSLRNTAEAGQGGCMCNKFGTWQKGMYVRPLLHYFKQIVFHVKPRSECICWHGMYGPGWQLVVCLYRCCMQQLQTDASPSAVNVCLLLHAGPLRIDIRLDTVQLPRQGQSAMPGRAPPETQPYARLRISSNGRHIHVEKLPDILDLGHNGRPLEGAAGGDHPHGRMRGGSMHSSDGAGAPHGAGPSSAAAPPQPGASEAGGSGVATGAADGPGSHLYGLYGHGMFMAIGRCMGAHWARWRGPP